MSPSVEKVVTKTNHVELASLQPAQGAHLPQHRVTVSYGWLVVAMLFFGPKMEDGGKDCACTKDYKRQRLQAGKN